MHLFLQEEGINEFLETLAFKNILNGVEGDSNAVVGDTALGKVVCPDPLRPISTPDLHNMITPNFPRTWTNIRKRHRDIISS